MSEKLEEYRKEIAEIDNQILTLIRARLQIAKKIGEIKRQQNLPVTNLKVEAEVISRAVKLARKTGLNEDFTINLIKLLIAEAVSVQEDTSEKNKENK